MINQVAPDAPHLYGRLSAPHPASRLRCLGGSAVFLIANLVFVSIPYWQDPRIAARSPIGWGRLVWGAAWVILR